MKGMLYAYLTLNRKYWIATAVVYVLVAVSGFIALLNFSDTDIAAAAFASMIMGIMPLAAPLILGEPMTRDLETNMKSRFAQYTLAAGISRHGYVSFYLLTNLAVNVIGIGLAALHYAIFSAAGNIVPLWDSFPLIVFVITAGNLFNWMLMPLTVSLKSADKAGMLAGLIFGFGVVLPFTLWLSGSENPDEAIARMFDITPEFQLVAYPVTAALYVVFYFIFYRRVKRGNM